jgi:sugar phosphate isomerase/epimerase
VESSPKVIWNVAASSGLFLNQPLLKALPVIREAGFRLLEISGNADHMDYHDKSLLPKVRAACGELGINVVSLHAPFGDSLDFTVTDENRRRHAITEIKASIDALDYLGGKALVIHCGSESEDARHESEHRLNQSAISLKEISCYCRDRGIKMVLENMLAHLLGGREGEMERVLGRLQGTNTGVCLDTWHAFLEGRLLEKTRLLGAAISMVHMHDNHGIYDDHLPPGEGKIEWPAFLDTLAKTGFSGGLVMEVVGRNLDPVLARRAWHSASDLGKYTGGKPYTLNLEGCLPSEFITNII